ncbi:MAG: iron transporter [Rubrobacteraceae bacterium]|nr:iron transporter [Rubrobacteraceae bacterium]MCL6437746.1 iron transporter [Rubrobacteraceae bacterium]
MHREERSSRPPMRPSDEATEEQLDLAREQGKALQKALEHMTREVADDGGEKRAGDYLVGYAVERAEGMYHMRDGRLEWQNPSEEENVHVEVSVRDGSDGRFIPGLEVHATLVDAAGEEVGTHLQPFLWHPWLYHYGRNWHVPGDGEYTLRVRIEPPEFHRHDKENGMRFTETVEVDFEGVKIKTGREVE